MAMLKCGQTDNDHYTFGIKKESENTISDVEHSSYCKACGERVSIAMEFCPQCGKKL